jgi:phosphatidylserine decarboxylase
LAVELLWALVWVGLNTVILGLLSRKWCLPLNRSAVIITLTAVVAFLTGWQTQQAGFPTWLAFLITGGVQLALYLGCLLWLFYRDPDRVSPDRPGVVLSPADGTVIYMRQLEAGEPLRSEKNGALITLEEIDGTSLSREPLWQIGISMVFTDVHVNRSPIRGVVTLVKHRAGQFLSLRRAEALNVNERQTLLIQGEKLEVLLVQIASRLVRQIVAYVKEGDQLDLGQRVGMIRFGSQVDVFLPASRVKSIEVGNGQRLTAGTTILCLLHDDD